MIGRIVLKLDTAEAPPPEVQAWLDAVAEALQPVYDLAMRDLLAHGTAVIWCDSGETKNVDSSS